MSSTLITLFEDLTGQPAPFGNDAVCACAGMLFGKGGMGWSQFNEIMILLGYDRVSAPFFQYLVDKSAEYKQGAEIKSEDDLRAAIDRFRKLAMLRFGNIKFAFKIISSLTQADLESQLDLVAPVDEIAYEGRHEPTRPIQRIAGEDTYYLGYIVQAEIEKRLRNDPNDQSALKEKEKRDKLVTTGIQNHEAYLASDHMDVYVATSMRARHEYYLVHKITEKIFDDRRLKKLKLRWFDPTQAYCHDRIDKGLAEALMLKRAKCTLYFVQENDTLGKDSELASTLAQGKPVIAFIPKIRDEQGLKWLLDAAQKIYPDRLLDEVIREQFQFVAPQLAWTDQWVMDWIHNPRSKSPDEVKRKLLDAVRNHYDKRAETLKDTHPLGIQVNLDTGVANGVLVARTTAQCAELIYRVITNKLEFRIDSKTVNERKYLLLRELTSESVFRVVSGDPLLTNAFWNFYLV